MMASHRRFFSPFLICIVSIWTHMVTCHFLSMALFLTSCPKTFGIFAVFLVTEKPLQSEKKHLSRVIMMKSERKESFQPVAGLAEHYEQTRQRDREAGKKSTAAEPHQLAPIPPPPGVLLISCQSSICPLPQQKNLLSPYLSTWWW